MSYTSLVCFCGNHAYHSPVEKAGGRTETARTRRRPNCFRARARYARSRDQARFRFRPSPPFDWLSSDRTQENERRCLGRAHSADELEEMKTWLLDTGPLVAALVAGDSAHHRVSETLASFRGTFVTTGAVLTEAGYLLRYARSGVEHLVEWVEESGHLHR